MSDKLAPLLLCTRLLPGESIYSLLFRLRQLNGYIDRRDFIQELCRGKVGALDTAFPIRDRDFHKLSELTQIDPDELRLASPHKYPSPEVRSPAYAAYCPDCLKQAAYHQLIWMPAEVTVCIKHRRLLAEKCPQCDHWLSISEVISVSCWTCGEDLSETVTPFVSSDEVGYFCQRLIQHWLGECSPPTGPLYSSLPKVDSKLQAAFFYKILRDLKNSSAWRVPTLLANRHDALAGAPAIHELAISAIRALLNWPAGFYSYLDLFYDLSDHAVYCEWLQRSFHMPADPYENEWQEFPFAFEAARAYAKGGTAASPSVRSFRPHEKKLAQRLFTYLTVEEAGRELSVSAAAIGRLAQLGLLPTQLAADRVFVAARDKVCILELHEKHLAVEQAAEWLGVSLEVMHELMQLPELQPESPTPADENFLFARAILDFYTRVSFRARPLHGPRPSQVYRVGDLQTVSSFSDATQFASAKVFVSAAQGDLIRYYGSSGPYGNLSDLFFRCEDLCDLMVHDKATQSGWVSKQTLMWKANLHHLEIQRLVHQGILKEVGKIRYSPGSVQYYFEISPQIDVHVNHWNDIDDSVGRYLIDRSAQLMNLETTDESEYIDG